MTSYSYAETPASFGVRDVVGLVLRRWWIVAIIFLLALALSYVGYKRTAKSYTATALLLVTTPPDTGAYNEASAASQPATELSMLQTDTMAVKTIDYLKDQSLQSGTPNGYSSLGIDDVTGMTTVTNPKDTNLIQISVENKDPKLTADLANATCKAFIQWNTSILNHALNQQVFQEENQLKLAHKKEVQAASRLEAFKLSHHMASLDSEQSLLLTQYEGDVAQLNNLTVQIANQQSQVNSLQQQLKQDNSSVLKTKSFRDISASDTLYAELQAAEQQYQQDLLKYKPDFQLMLNEKSRINELRKEYQAASTTAINDPIPTASEQNSLQQSYTDAAQRLVGLQKQYAVVAQQRDAYAVQKNALPPIQMEYGQLKNDSELAENVYQRTQSQLTNTQVNMPNVHPNVEVAQVADIPTSPSYPIKKTYLLFGGGIGLVLGIATVVLLEQTDQRLRTTGKAREVLPGAVIGALPKVSENHIRQLLQGGSTGRTAESYSLARANLSLALRNMGQGCQVVLVTSALAGEGKSVTAAALARSSARAGKRVVLVEADMRRPSMNNMFRTSEPTGLADVLEGAMSLDDALVGSDQDNLTLLYSGTPTMNPSDLIARPEMAEVLEILRREADIVFVDSPPCSLVADALVLAPMADCILQVVSLDMADQPSTLETTAALKAAEPRTMVYFVNRSTDEPNQAYSTYYTKQAPKATEAVNRDLKVLQAGKDEDTKSDN